MQPSTSSSAPAPAQLADQFDAKPLEQRHELWIPYGKDTDGPADPSVPCGN